jgi:hypothetical protein
MRRKVFARPATIKSWAILIMDLNFQRARPDEIFGKFAGPLAETLKNRGIILFTNSLLLGL